MRHGIDEQEFPGGGVFRTIGEFAVEKKISKVVHVFPKSRKKIWKVVQITLLVILWRFLPFHHDFYHLGDQLS